MKKDQVTTAAMEIFKGKQILNERPEDMTMDEYRFLRNTQNKLIKKLFKKPNNQRISQFVNAPLNTFKKLSFNPAVRKVTQRKTA